MYIYSRIVHSCDKVKYYNGIDESEGIHMIYISLQARPYLCMCDVCIWREGRMVRRVSGGCMKRCGHSEGDDCNRAILPWGNVEQVGCDF